MSEHVLTCAGSEMLFELAAILHIKMSALLFIPTKIKIFKMKCPKMGFISVLVYEQKKWKGGRREKLLTTKEIKGGKK